MTTDVEAAANELFSMMESDPETGPKRAVFLRIERGKTRPEEKARRIGEFLYDRYGTDALHAVASILQRKVMDAGKTSGNVEGFDMRSDLRELEFAWDGIGDWQA